MRHGTHDLGFGRLKSVPITLVVGNCVAGSVSRLLITRVRVKYQTPQPKSRCLSQYREHSASRLLAPLWGQRIIHQIAWHGTAHVGDLSHLYYLQMNHITSTNLVVLLPPKLNQSMNTFSLNGHTGSVGAAST
jgi:hypothetical protein